MLHYEGLAHLFTSLSTTDLLRENKMSQNRRKCRWVCMYLNIESDIFNSANRL